LGAQFAEKRLPQVAPIFGETELVAVEVKVSIGMKSDVQCGTLPIVFDTPCRGVIH